MTDTTANLPPGCSLAYVVFAEAWYYQHHNELRRERDYIGVMASADPNGSSCAWEFEVEDRSDLRPGTIRLHMFDDSFAALDQIPAFFAALADRQPGSLAEVREILDEMGARDETARVNPYVSVRGPEGERS